MRNISLRSSAGVETRRWFHAEHAACMQQCVACFPQWGVCACLLVESRLKAGDGFPSPPDVGSGESILREFLMFVSVTEMEMKI